jgi:hypothetical protein
MNIWNFFLSKNVKVKDDKNVKVIFKWSSNKISKERKSKIWKIDWIRFLKINEVLYDNLSIKEELIQIWEYRELRMSKKNLLKNTKG